MIERAPTPAELRIAEGRPKWRIVKERITVRPMFSGENFQPFLSHPAWSVYYGRKRVARYLAWVSACDHVAMAHRRFGL